MARGKRMSEKVQRTVDRLLNGVREPSFTALTSDNSSMMHGLTYYANHAKQDQSKKWAIDFAQKNMPEIVGGLKNKKDWQFSNRGFVIRMMNNGYVLSEAQLTGIKKFLVELSKQVEPEVEEKKKPIARKTVVHDAALEEFDYAIDDILQGKEPRKVALGLGKNESIVNECNRILGEMETNPDYFAKDTMRPLKKFASGIKAQLEMVVKAVKQERVKKVAPKNVVPTKMVSKLPFKKADSELGLVGLRPEALIGAKQAIVYCAKYRFLMYFKSSSDEGFMASGATLKNFDTEKSVFKKIRNPAEMAAAMKDASLSAMKKFLETVKSTEYPGRGRFNDEMLILKVTG